MFPNVFVSRALRGFDKARIKSPTTGCNGIRTISLLISGYPITMKITRRRNAKQDKCKFITLFKKFTFLLASSYKSLVYEY